jgi:hypothetical protein
MLFLPCLCCGFPAVASLHVLLTAWVTADIRFRGMNEVLWPLLALLTGPVGAAVYLLCRSKKGVSACKGCGRPLFSADDTCRWCAKVDEREGGWPQSP